MAGVWQTLNTLNKRVKVYNCNLNTINKGLSIDKSFLAPRIFIGLYDYKSKYIQVDMKLSYRITNNQVRFTLSNKQWCEVYDFFVFVWDDYKDIGSSGTSSGSWQESSEMVGLKVYNNCSNNKDQTIILPKKSKILAVVPLIKELYLPQGFCQLSLRFSKTNKTNTIHPQFKIGTLLPTFKTGLKINSENSTKEIHLSSNEIGYSFVINSFFNDRKSKTYKYEIELIYKNGKKEIKNISHTTNTTFGARPSSNKCKTSMNKSSHPTKNFWLGFHEYFGCSSWSYSDTIILDSNVSKIRLKSKNFTLNKNHFLTFNVSTIKANTNIKLSDLDVKFDLGVVYTYE